MAHGSEFTVRPAMLARYRALQQRDDPDRLAQFLASRGVGTRHYLASLPPAGPLDVPGGINPPGGGYPSPDNRPPPPSLAPAGPTDFQGGINPPGGGYPSQDNRLPPLDQPLPSAGEPPMMLEGFPAARLPAPPYLSRYEVLAARAPGQLEAWLASRSPATRAWAMNRAPRQEWSLAALASGVPPAQDDFAQQYDEFWRQYGRR